MAEIVGRRIYRRLSWGLAALMAAAVIVPLLLLVWVRYDLKTGRPWTPRYDREHPDYPRYVAIMREQHRAAAGDSWPLRIDLAALADGQWQTACFFGSYSDPIGVMRKAGGLLAREDVARLEAAGWRGFRLATIEASEALIAYFGDDRAVRLIHLDQGLGPNAEYTAACVTRPETVLALPRPN